MRTIDRTTFRTKREAVADKADTPLIGVSICPPILAFWNSMQRAYH